MNEIIIIFLVDAQCVYLHFSVNMLLLPIGGLREKKIYSMREQRNCGEPRSSTACVAGCVWSILEAALIVVGR